MFADFIHRPESGQLAGPACLCAVGLLRNLTSSHDGITVKGLGSVLKAK